MHGNPHFTSSDVSCPSGYRLKDLYVLAGETEFPPDNSGEETGAEADTEPTAGKASKCQAADSGTAIKGPPKVRHILDKHGRMILPGDTLKIFHFTGPRRKRYYMYKYVQWEVHGFFRILHLNVRDEHFLMELDGKVHPDIEIVQGWGKDGLCFEDRPIYGRASRASRAKVSSPRKLSARSCRARRSTRA